MQLADTLTHLSFRHILHGCFAAKDAEDRKLAYSRSLETASEGLRLKTPMVGPEDRSLSQTLGNYGMALYRAGRFEEAVSCYNRQRDILVKHDLADHTELASCYYNIGMV